MNDVRTDWRSRCEHAVAQVRIAPTTTDWLTVEQEQVDRFARATLDPDPIHTSPAWARVHSPYGGTIAPGLWTLAAVVSLLQRSGALAPLEAALGVGYGLHYGYNRLRFISPLVVGARFRAAIEPRELRLRERGGVLLTLGMQVEIERAARPALSCDWLIAYIEPMPSSHPGPST